MKWIKMLRMLALIVMGLIALLFAIALLVYPPAYIYRTLVWQASDAFDWQKFPAHPLNAAPMPYHFAGAPNQRVEELFEQLSGADDWRNFLAANSSQAFIVIQDGTVLYEQYFNNTQRDSIVTSFSVAKSFDSALIGIALQEGHIKSVD
ncbi:MAG: hypothetical protein NT075_08485, partial [Chloroflexi bacterium]|nr:hypothetical protein [Chloroflexota bacterium]